MIDWAWWFPALTVVAVAVGVYFVVNGATCRGAERTARWAHALMAAAMAVMFSPWPSLIPPTAGAVAFTVLGAWFAASRLRGGTGAPDEPTHVAVGSAAMVVMYLGMPSHPAAGAEGGTHTGHLAAASAGTSSLLAVVVGLALTGYFAWHAWETASVPRRAASADGPGSTVTLSRMRTETAAHVVLDVLMAVMFLSML